MVLGKPVADGWQRLVVLIPEIMAISGHKSLAEVERYIKVASQKLLAEQAIARTLSYPRADKSYPRRKKS